MVSCEQARNLLLEQQPLPGLKYGKTVEKKLASEVKESVAETAHQITVRIFTNRGAGSGVIIDHQGKTYTVLTNDHVVNGSRDNHYTVLTADAQSHAARRKTLPNLSGIDLGLVEFESEIVYEVAVLRNSEITIGEKVYAAGFPNYSYNDQGFRETFDWGLRAFKLTTGTLEMLMSEISLLQGYKMGYTNDVELGMSGGPVLDHKGQVIGINGRTKKPFQGIEVFQLTDGNYPNPELFKKMDALSWAIPINIFLQRTDTSVIFTEEQTQSVYLPKVPNNI
ncbi:MAG: trypsin-like peptidase domain-containing protein [Moorea sp. SIO1G6]|uniref:S1 family peptidase n=1 Tax=Moorena sp. SIO1G6 TaxID=2607840 RepID=UPI0013C24C17|nr:serine protease [Moorena sp. SIO1G6]NET63761.1 trypsin-like peptidase domain-containing protein [Moorena sp. SIO1G6]